MTLLENETSVSQNVNETHMRIADGPLVFDEYLALVSDTLDDIEGLRIAMENRFRSLTRSVEDKDGEVRGLGFTAAQPEVATVLAILTGVEEIEKNTIKALQKQIKASPFYPWIKAQKGIGEKQAARLIAVIGDPYWNNLHNRPRTVSELWAYCGYSVIGGVAQRRTKGQKSNWSPKAKSRAFLMAQQVVISGKGGHYNELYYAIKEKSVGAIHSNDCVRCGPSGKPALAGSELSDGHRDARAKRQISKEILKDLWLAAREVHLNS